MMSVTQVLKGLMATTYPIVVRFLVEAYGFRGATAILAAIHAHTIFGMMLMHPIGIYRIILFSINRIFSWIICFLFRLAL